MKQIYRCLLVLLSALSQVISAQAYDFAVDDIYYNKLTDTTCSVTCKSSTSSGYSGNVVIPEIVTYRKVEYKVTSIEERAFEYSSDLTSVTIPNSVTQIGTYAFRACKGLTSITIPGSVTSVGTSAFASCTGITELNIEDSETKLLIATNAFSGVSPTTAYLGRNISSTIFKDKYMLQNLTIGEKVTSISEYAFSGCSSLNSVIIPSSVTEIEPYVFYDCRGLTSVSIPSSVTSIGASAFYQCVSLTSLTIPSSVSSIGESAFSGCIGLERVNITDLNSWCSISFERTSSNPLTYSHHLYVNNEEITKLSIPNTVTSIGQYVFNGFTGMTEVNIPNSVTSIGTSAFHNCTGMTEVNIPNSVISIGTSAFQNCTSLAEVNIPNSVTSIEEAAFDGCTGLERVNITDIGSWCNISFTSSESNPLNFAHHLYSNGEEITELSIPNTVTSVGSYAFYGCTGFKSVTIPKSVTLIGKDAFYGCSGLVKCAYPNSISNPISYGVSIAYPASDCVIEDGVIWNTDKSTIYFVPINYQGGFNIPSSVTSIGKAFCYCTSITSVTIPSTVTTIENNAFKGCEELSDIRIPRTVTTIGSDAFKGCKDNARIIDCSYAISGDYSSITDGNKVIYCYRGRTYRNSADSKLIYLEDVVYPVDKVEKINRLQFKLGTISDVEVSNITVYDSNEKAVKDNSGLYVVSGRKANITYKLYGLDVSYDIETTVNPELSLTLVEATQSTLTVAASITNDGTMNVEKLVIYPYYSSESYPQEVKDGEACTLNFYCPGCSYGVRVKAYTDAGEYDLTNTYTTMPLNLKVEATEYGPCRVKYVASWDKGDAIIKSKGFTKYSNSSDGDGTLVYASEDGLDPLTSITLYYVVTTKSKYGNKTYTLRQNLSSTLPKLEWYENAPVATSTTSCRIISSTNCNANSGTGFEWKRYDAPDALAATKVSCPVVDGIVVGSLRNLNPEVYYKYRPYYESKAGTTYYGEWTVFFTGDANVYFEPDVRTLEDIAILSNSVVLTGYVLPGSDDVQSQGFQYRKIASRGASRIAALTGQNAEEWISVTASGIKPSVTIDELDFDAQYEYRVYATTKNSTYYGESRYFTIESQTGIDDVVVDNSHNNLTLNVNSNPGLKIAVSGSLSEIVPYEIYNISGAHIAHGEVEADGDYHTVSSELIHGVYVVVVSDGSGVATRKVIVR